MKRMAIFCFTLIFTFLSSGLKAQVKNLETYDGVYMVVLLVSCIIVLTILGIWLYNNSAKLNELTKLKPMEEDWIDHELYNLNAEQIDSLLKYKESQKLIVKQSDITV